MEHIIINPLAKVIKPPPKIKVSEWADKYRVLSRESSAEPGLWVTARAEYQRDIMDNILLPNVERITFMASSQVGKTEIINNIIGYYIANDPCPILVIQPTLEMAQTWSKDRFMPMVRDCILLRNIVADEKSRNSSNTILHKTFAGGHITVAGANSPSSLSSRPVRLLIFDEVDRYPQNIGNEGDPIQIGMKRTLTFWNRKIIATSTPTVKGLSKIEQLFEQSNQSYYYVPCPYCNYKQKLQFHQLKWEGEKVWYECENCKKQLDEKDKYYMIANGEWVADKPEVINHIGFHINELYSPWSSWENIMKNFLEAKKNRFTLKVFINTTLGQSFEEEESYNLDEENLLKRVEDYEKIPDSVLLLTAGVDIQDDRIECLIKGWGLGEESWFIDYKIIYGSPAKQEIWNLLDNILNSVYDGEYGEKYRVISCCIDSGGHFTQQVYNFVKSRQINRIFAVKGMAGEGRPIIGRPSKNNKMKVNLFPIGVDTIKELIYSRLGIDEVGPGYMHFNAKCDSEYFKQLTAEACIKKYVKGYAHKVWVKKRARNEALDCEVYATAAYYILNPNLDILYKQKLERVPKKKEADDIVINGDKMKIKKKMNKNYVINYGW